jgi:Glucosamine 6-phosphate synthetase, contains amidotransferase and phosphosugar isomerase domains
MSLTLISMMLAEAKGAMDSENLKRIADEIKMLPEKIQTMIDRREEYKFIAEEFKDARNFLYLGRGYNFPSLR